MSFNRHEIVIPLDLYTAGGGSSGWTLKLVRENNSSHVLAELFWRDKADATHGGAMSLEFFEKSFRALVDTTGDVE